MAYLRDRAAVNLGGPKMQNRARASCYAVLSEGETRRAGCWQTGSRKQ